MHSIYVQIVTFVLFIVLSSCQQEEVPSVLVLPQLSELKLHTVTTNEADVNGNIVKTGSTPILALGVCWATNSLPAVSDERTKDSSIQGAFASQIRGLKPNTTYYIRAYMMTATDTIYSDEKTFKTFDTIDIDGNGYHSVKIGNQVWLDKNLQVTRYRNGDAIPNVSNGQTWFHLSSGAYCYFDNKESNKEALGLLYNWYAIADPRNIAPEGWHVASDAEWEVLVDFLGGPDVAGRKLKQTGTTYWFYPNSDADNSSRFSGISAGQRGVDGEFFGPGSYGCFWTSTQEDSMHGRDWFLYAGDATVTRYYDKKVNGFNVRCIKDL